MQYFVRCLSPGSAGTDSGRGGKLNNHLMVSCIKKILTKTYYNWITFLQVWWKKLVCFLCLTVYYIKWWFLFGA